MRMFSDAQPATYGAPIRKAIFLGAGLSTTPNIHVGEKEGSKAFIQTSVGQIVEIPQPNLPYKNYQERQDQVAGY